MISSNAALHSGPSISKSKETIYVQDWFVHLDALGREMLFPEQGIILYSICKCTGEILE